VAVGTGACVGAAVGAGGWGAPPHATRITPSRIRAPRSTKLFFIVIYDILLSMGFEAKPFLFFDGGHLLTDIKFSSRIFNLFFILI
jgi:hypothetical protein